MKLSDEEIARRAKLAQDLGQTAHERRPDSQSWGMWSYGDAPGAIGGGEGAFFWFNSEAELLDYVATYLPFDPPGPITVPIESVLASVGEIVESLKNREVEREQARLDLNKALKHFSQIEWWGPGGELFSGDAQFPRALRADYRRKGPSTGPITAEEEDDFLDFLETYPYG